MCQTTSQDGTRIGFVRSGQGPPLLLVHGTTADHRRWDAISERLAPHFTIYAMDRRGRGRSEDAPEYAIAREAEDVAAVIASIVQTAGEPVSVLAHSYGAVCSLEAALLTPHIRRLILYEPPIPTGIPMYPPEVPGLMRDLIARDQKEAALEVFMREVVRMPERELEAYRRLPMWQGRVALAPTIPREVSIDQSYRFEPERFAGLRVPTMLLLGGDSPPLFRRAIEVLDEALPASHVVELPGQQHIAMDTAPELFLDAVRPFLVE